jgi:autotransporter-associated beta strand protein
MNKPSSKLLTVLPVTLVIVLTLMANYAKAQAPILYWDINGTTVGSGGPTPSGTWEDASLNWTVDSTGSSATVGWTEGSFAEFSAGTDAIGSYTVTANSDHTVAGMLVQASTTGTVTVNGPGVMTIADGIQGFSSTFAGSGLQLNCVLTGTGGLQTYSGSTLSLYATNGYSGGTLLNLGQTYFNNNYAFGTGPLTNNTAAFSALLASGGAALSLTNDFYVTTTGAGINFAGSTATPLTSSGNWNLQQTFSLRDNADSTSPLTLSGAISGAADAGLVISGNNSVNSGGKVILSGANTYTGPTSLGANDINAGNGEIVVVSSLNSVATPTPMASSSLGCPSSVANGTIHIGVNSTTNMLIYIGPGETTDRVIDLTGTARGPWIQADGTGPLVFTSDFTTSVGGVNANTKWLTLQGTNTGLNTIGGKIANFDGSHQVSVTKDGSGTWVLSGVNTFAGSPLNIYNGTLIIGGAGQLSSGSYAGAITNAGTFTYASSAAQTLTGNMTGTGALIVSNDSGNLTLNGTTTSPNITISAGTLTGNKGSPGAFIGLPTITFGSSGHAGTLDLDGRTTTGIAGLVVAPGATGATIQNSAAGAATLGFSGGTSTFGGNIVAGPGIGTTALTVASGMLTLTGVNTYTGGTTITGGTLALANDTGVGTAAINLNSTTGGTIQSADSNTRTIGNAITLSQPTIFGATGTGDLVFSGAVNSGGAAKTFTVNNTKTTFNGVISGNGAVALMKDGPGTLVFGGANTFNKQMVISAGTLEINNATPMVSTSVTVNGGVLKLDYSTALPTGATLNLAASPAANTVNLAFSGTQTITALNFGATSMAKGTWGRIGSGALHENAAFASTGNGLLLVTSGGPTPASTTIPSISGTTLSYSSGAGSQFVLLGTNNVAAPLSLWTRLATNGSTPGSFTIPAVGSQPQRFYRVKSE